MKLQMRWISLLGAATSCALAFTVQLTAQDRPNHRPPQYRLKQVGTFGGPTSDYLVGPGFALENYFNSQGASVGIASTNISDPFSPNCFDDCFVDRAMMFHGETLTDLGSISINSNSGAYGINDNGLIVGISENGSTDPETGYPEYHAVAWRHGEIRDLGTLGGTVSQFFAVNNRNQAVGVAANDIPDPYSSGLGPCTSVNCWPVTTQQRAVLWDGVALRDLGTLGGDDAVAYYINDAGQVVGVSYTNTTPNGTTGLPTQDPFLWDRGRMVDLGSLGGTVGFAQGFNNRGQVAGQSNLAGDQVFHPFIWDRGVLTDLGTLGGDLATTRGLNDAGDVVGASLTSGNQAQHAFLWRHGRLTDLGALAGDTASFAFHINLVGTIVGASCSTQACRAAVWLGGAPVDLNTLVVPSNLQLTTAYSISESGEILAVGTLPNGDERIAVLTPIGD